MKSRKLSGLIVLAVVACVFGAAKFASAASVDFFLKIEGTKQGQIKGDGAAASGRLPGSQFKYEESATTLRSRRGKSDGCRSSDRADCGQADAQHDYDRQRSGQGIAAAFQSNEYGRSPQLR